MADLPTEIWWKIWDELDYEESKQDIRNFRLACKRFASVGTELLFKVVNVTVTKASLTRLEILANNENIAPRIGRLYLWTEILAPYSHVSGGTESDNFALWMSVLRILSYVSAEGNEFIGPTAKKALLGSKKLNRELWPRNEICRHWDIIQREQLQLLKNELQSSIRASASKISRLDSLSVSVKPHHEEDFKNVSVQDRYNRRDRNKTARASAQMVQASVFSLSQPAQLRSLYCEELDFGAFDVPDLNARLGNLSKVQFIEPGIAMGGAASEDKQRNLNERMGKFLSYGQSITYLEIRLQSGLLEGDRRTRRVFHSIFKDCLREHVWPHLNTFVISNGDIDGDFMVRFFERHKQSPQHVLLRHIALDSTRPEAWIEFLKKINLATALTSISFQGRLYIQNCEFRKDCARFRRKLEPPINLELGKALSYLVCGDKSTENGEMDELGDESNAERWDHVSWKAVEECLLNWERRPSTITSWSDVVFEPILDL